jgi:NitT/TauT family transport system ATP-binding protein
MSPRPGQFIEEFIIPFGNLRAEELRYTPDFASLTGRIAAAFRGARQ